MYESAIISANVIGAGGTWSILDRAPTCLDANLESQLELLQAQSETIDRFVRTHPTTAEIRSFDIRHCVGRNPTISTPR